MLNIHSEIWLCLSTMMIKISQNINTPINCGSSSWAQAFTGLLTPNVSTILEINLISMQTLHTGLFKIMHKFQSFLINISQGSLSHCCKRPASAKTVMEPFGAIRSLGKSFHSLQLDHSVSRARGLNERTCVLRMAKIW